MHNEQSQGTYPWNFLTLFDKVLIKKLYKVEVKVQYCVMCKHIRRKYIETAGLTIKIPYIQGSIVFFQGGRAQWF